MEIVRRGLAAGFTPGRPLDHSLKDVVDVSADIMDEHEELYRVLERGNPLMNIQRDDILVVEPRCSEDVSTGEIVLVEHEDLAYIGRWWAKRGRVAVVDEDRRVVVAGPGVRVLGVVTLVARPGEAR